MDTKDLKKAVETLTTALPARKIKWRVMQKGETNGRPWAKIIAYIASRDLMHLLDLAFGPWGWTNQVAMIHYREPEPLDEDEKKWRPGYAVAKSTIRVKELGVEHSDMADYEGTEAAKGAATQAFRRAAVYFNIGRCRSLYELDGAFADICAADEVPFKYRFKGKDGKYVGWRPPTIGVDAKGNYHIGPGALPVGSPPPAPQQAPPASGGEPEQQPGLPEGARGGYEAPQQPPQPAPQQVPSKQPGDALGEAEIMGRVICFGGKNKGKTWAEIERKRGAKGFAQYIEFLLSRDLEWKDQEALAFFRGRYDG